MCTGRACVKSPPTATATSCNWHTHTHTHTLWCTKIIEREKKVPLAFSVAKPAEPSSLPRRRGEEKSVWPACRAAVHLRVSCHFFFHYRRRHHHHHHLILSFFCSFLSEQPTQRFFFLKTFVTLEKLAAQAYGLRKTEKTEKIFNLFLFFFSFFSSSFSQ